MARTTRNYKQNLVLESIFTQGEKMSVEIEKYLNKVNKNLKPLPLSMRTDIIAEIKSNIAQMQANNISSEQILESLGNPKTLAKEYLANLITSKKTTGIKRVLLACAFYSLASLSGIILIPTLGILAPTFIFSGVVTIIAVTVNLFSYLLLGYGIPYIQVLDYSPVPGFFIGLAVGIILATVGLASWKALKLYILGITKVNEKIQK